MRNVKFGRRVKCGFAFHDLRFNHCRNYCASAPARVLELGVGEHREVRKCVLKKPPEGQS